MTIRPIQFLDTWALTAAVYRERKGFETLDGPAPTLDLSKSLKDPKWGSARSVVAKALTILTGIPIFQNQRPKLIGVAVEKLMPFGHTPWTKDIETGDLTVHYEIPLVTNPGAFLYCGRDSMSITTGWLTYVDVSALHCAVNHSEFPRYHLIVDVKRPELITDALLAPGGERADQ